MREARLTTSHSADACRIDGVNTYFSCLCCVARSKSPIFRIDKTKDTRNEFQIYFSAFFSLQVDTKQKLTKEQLCAEVKVSGLWSHSISNSVSRQKHPSPLEKLINFAEIKSLKHPFHLMSHFMMSV